MPAPTNAYRILAVGAASAALLAACNFIPGMGGNRNAANSVANGASVDITAAAGNAVGLDTGSGMETANTAPPPPLPAAVAAQLPNLRPGLWAQTSTTNNGAPETETVCLRGGPLRMEFSRECPTPTPTQGPDGDWVVETTCTGRLGPVSVRLTSRGDYQNHYSMDGHFSLRPTDPNTPPREMRIHMDAVYQGQCPPGQQPGGPPQGQQPQQQQPQDEGQAPGDEGVDK